MKKILGLFLSVFLGATIFYHTAEAHPATYSAWSYFKQIDFDDNTPVANYQVQVTLTTINFDYSKAKSDGSDIRFADFNDNIVRYFIESWNNTGTSVIWIKVPVSGTIGVNIYYGNSAAVSESSGDNVFDFYDDFSGSALDLSKWNINNSGGGTVNVAGGNLVIYQSTTKGEWTAVVADNSFGPNIIMESRARLDYGNNYISGGIGINDWTSGSPYDWAETLFNGVTYYDQTRFNTDIYGSSVKNGTASVFQHAYTNNTYYIYKQRWTGSEVVMYIDDVVRATISNTIYIPVISLYPIFYNYVNEDNNANNPETQYMDWIRVRKYNSTTGEIIVNSFGDEEGVSSTTVTATVPSSLTFNISGVTMGVACANSGGNASVTSTSNSITFGLYTGAQTKIACQNLTVSTNATNGYVVTMQQEHDLSSPAGDVIGKFTGTYTVPTLWSSPSGGANSYFGFTTNDTDYSNFQTAKYAGIVLDDFGYGVMQSAGPVEDATNVISYQLEVNNLQEAGIYSTNIMYIVTASY